MENGAGFEVIYDWHVPGSTILLLLAYSYRRNRIPCQRIDGTLAAVPQQCPQHPPEPTALLTQRTAGLATLPHGGE